MSRVRRNATLGSGLGRLQRDESGHATLGLLDIAAASGAVLLAAGAASGEDVLTIIGGAALAVGIFAGGVVRHTSIDYEMWRRLDRIDEADEPKQ